MTVASLAMSLAKDDLRQQMRGARLALPAAKAQILADGACARLTAWPQFVAARAVALYAPVRGEISTDPIAGWLNARGVAVLYPRMDENTRLLAFCAAEKTSLTNNRIGIPEPSTDAAPFHLDAIDLFVVPGLAFDDAGDRLGWGRGYYDTTLRAAPHALRVGLAYNFQRVATVPADADDERIDLLVTEQSVHVTQARPAHPTRRLS